MQTLERIERNDVLPKQPGKRAGETAFFLALILFVLGNVLFCGPVRHLHKIEEVIQQAKQEEIEHVPPQHSWAWWLSKFYLEEKQAPDIVVFGSSLLGTAHASIDAQYLSKLLDTLTQRRMVYLEKQLELWGGKASVFSLGCPGEMISDAYVMSKTLFQQKKPKVVVATIAPRDFMDSTLAYPGVTDQYRFFSKFHDFSRMNNYAYPEFFSRLGIELDALPIKQLGKKVVSTYAELPKTDLHQREEFTIQPGQSMVPARAIPKRIDNTREYVERFKSPLSQNYISEMSFFRSWLKDMKQQGIVVLVMCMPTTSANRRLLPESFWQRFRSDVSAACKENEADWFDMSDCTIFQPTDYLDTVHLNAFGAVRLFPVMAQRILMYKPAADALSNHSTGPSRKH